MAQVRFLVLLSLLVDLSVATCPDGCRCQKMADCNLLVECKRLKSFPSIYPEGADCIFLNSGALGKLSVEQKQIGLSDLPATTKRLDLAESRLGEIRAGWFDHLSELRVLNLEFNKLKAIPSNVFQALSKLKVLWLTGNHYGPEEPEYKKMKAAGNLITDVRVDAFAGLDNLQVLLLHHNKITTFDDGVFRDLGKLKVLKLLDNPVTERLGKRDKVFDPIRSYCYQLDLRGDSGDELEDYWEKTRTYLSDEWFEGPPGRKKKKKKKNPKQDRENSDL